MEAGASSGEAYGGGGNGDSREGCCRRGRGLSAVVGVRTWESSVVVMGLLAVRIVTYRTGLLLFSICLSRFSFLTLSLYRFR